MSFRTELVAFAVRVLAEKTNLVRKPAPFEDLISDILTGETYDQRIARDIVGKTDEVVALVKGVKTRCRNKKIPPNEN